MHLSVQGASRRVLRPAWAYLGPASAQAFCRFRTRSAQAQAMAAGLGPLAVQIGAHLRPEPLEVLALGAGDGTHEVLLLESLRAAGAVPASLALLDLSEPLLARAYPHAVERLPQVDVWALLADLEELSVHADVLFLPKRQRLVLALGGLLGELEDELRFVRHGLARCTEGDLLALDVPCAAGDTAALVQDLEGAAVRRLLQAARTWLTAALVPHLPDVPLEWSLRLETGGVVPGSHAWCATSRIPILPRPREIEIYRWRRYDPRRLTACLAGLDWDLVAACSYGAAAGELHLYRRRAMNDSLRGEPSTTESASTAVRSSWAPCEQGGAS